MRATRNPTLRKWISTTKSSKTSEIHQYIRYNVIKDIKKEKASPILWVSQCVRQTNRLTCTAFSLRVQHCTLVSHKGGTPLCISRVCLGTIAFCIAGKCDAEAGYGRCWVLYEGKTVVTEDMKFQNYGNRSSHIVINNAFNVDLERDIKFYVRLI